MSNLHKLEHQVDLQLKTIKLFWISLADLWIGIKLLWALCQVFKQLMPHGQEWKSQCEQLITSKNKALVEANSGPLMEHHLDIPTFLLVKMSLYWPSIQELYLDNEFFLYYKIRNIER